MSTPPSRLERLTAARQGFIRRAFADSEQMHLLLQRVRSGDRQAVERIRELAHRLTGTAGSYGFTEVTKAAAATVAVVETEFVEQELVTAIDRLRGEITRMGGNTR